MGCVESDLAVVLVRCKRTRLVFLGRHQITGC